MIIDFDQMFKIMLLFSLFGFIMGNFAGWVAWGLPLRWIRERERKAKKAKDAN